MRIWNRIRYLVNRRQLEQELADELRIHAEMAEDELRRGGLLETEARHGAQRTMGNVVHALEDSRARWNFASLESMLLDVRYALRSFRRTPIFAGTVIGTIGLALGLNTALFSIFNAYVLRPFAVRDPYSIYALGWTTKGDTHYVFTSLELESARRQTRIFSEVLASRNLPFITRAEGQYVWGAAVSGNYFTALGVGPVVGRTILPRDEGPQGNPNVLVLSYTAWKEKFGGAADIAGKTLRVRPEYFSVFKIPLLQGRTFTIEEARARAPVVVVSEATARRFWPARDALGQTIRIEADTDDPRCKEAPRYHTARVIGVAKNVSSGITALDAADANCLYFPMDSRSAAAGSLLVTVKGSVDVARRHLDRALARTNPGAVDTIVPMQQVIAAIVYPFRVSFWISSLLGILALVLTVSGIYGVMSYLVSQRSKEIGIRMALGASTAGVLWMVLKQSMKMAALGITAGVVLAAGASRLLASQMEMILVNTFDVMAYAGGVMLVILAAVAASYIPSRRAAQIDPGTTLRFE